MVENETHPVENDVEDELYTLALSNYLQPIHPHRHIA
jgi:hypothetical protein